MSDDLKGMQEDTAWRTQLLSAIAQLPEHVDLPYEYTPEGQRRFSSYSSGEHLTERFYDIASCVAD